ncbi:MAG: transglutaminase-like domain-containing protein [Candidatus Sabulitectum sp.]|nr:transglutaminase-like domain-containing protein [Candidatus Sabulitectum sp.]
MKTVKGYLLALITVLAAAGCGADSSDDDVRETFATADFQKFAVSLQGEDVGYMTMSTEAVGDSLFITQSMEWHLLLMGTTRTVTMSVQARTGTNMDLGYLTMTMSDGTSVIETAARRVGNTVETTVNTSGREITNSSEFEGDYLPSFVDLAAATMEWTAGDEKTFPTFDPSTGMIFQATVTCEAIEDVSLMGDMVPAARLLIAQQGMRTSVWVHQGQIVREEEAGMGMVLTRVAPDTEDNIIPTSDLYEVYAVTSNDVQDPRRAGERSWLLAGDVDWSEFELDYPGIQTVSDGPVITVTAFAPQNSLSFPMTEVSDELAPFLVADAMIQCVDPEIVAVADSLTEDATDAWDAVTRISRFVDRGVENVPTVSLPSAVDVLDNMRGDCNEHTILTVALCRAAGIPAVTCAGIVYVDNGIFGYHAWPAVWVGEWVAIDPTFSQPMADCTHIVLAQGSLDAQYVVNGVLGRLSIEEQ